MNWIYPLKKILTFHLTIFRWNLWVSIHLVFIKHWAYRYVHQITDVSINIINMLQSKTIQPIPMQKNIRTSSAMPIFVRAQHWPAVLSPLKFNKFKDVHDSTLSRWLTSTDQKSASICLPHTHKNVVWFFSWRLGIIISYCYDHNFVILWFDHPFKMFVASMHVAGVQLVENQSYFAH